MVDRDLILRKLASLEEYLGQLAPYRTIELAAYQGDWKTQRIVERTLHLAIEASMDVADHIVADRRLRVPETGGETFEILGEADLLPTDLARALARMVGFRDPEIVLRVLQSDGDDLTRFREAVLPLITP